MEARLEITAGLDSSAESVECTNTLAHIVPPHVFWCSAVLASFAWAGGGWGGGARRRAAAPDIK